MPGTREAADQAYAMAGEATVAQSDLVIAIWDGNSARGLGGTADVVDYAIRRGVRCCTCRAIPRKRRCCSGPG